MAAPKGNKFAQGLSHTGRPPIFESAGDVNQWTSDSAAYECDVCNGKKIINYKLVKP